MQRERNSPSPSHHGLTILFTGTWAQAVSLPCILSPCHTSELHASTMVNKRAFDDCIQSAPQVNKLKRGRKEAPEPRIRPHTSERTATSSQATMRRFPALNLRVQQLREEICENEDCFPMFRMVPSGSKATTILRAGDKSVYNRCGRCGRNPISLSVALPVPRHSVY